MEKQPPFDWDKSILPDSVRVRPEHFKYWKLLDTQGHKQLGEESSEEGDS